MNLPDCYDPAAQEDRRQQEWDEFSDMLPVCTLCRRRLYPGDKFHSAKHAVICPQCLEELNDNEDEVEVA